MFAALWHLWSTKILEITYLNRIQSRGSLFISHAPSIFSLVGMDPWRSYRPLWKSMILNLNIRFMSLNRFTIFCHNANQGDSFLKDSEFNFVVAFVFLPQLLKRLAGCENSISGSLDQEDHLGNRPWSVLGIQSEQDPDQYSTRSIYR